MIDIQGLSFRYPRAERDAIQGLSLKVREGSLFGLLGPNGSGKTTLISILTGLLTPAAGRVRVAGHPMPAEARAAQTLSALVPQDYAFYPRLTVAENLRFFAGVCGIPAVEREGRVGEAVAITGLEAFRQARAEYLSGGLKRRLNLSIGLLNRPRLLFLDEPTVGIDPQSRQFILEAIKHINSAGATVIYTSHYMEEVEVLCDEIGVLDNGRLLAHGSLQELLDGGDRGLTVDLAAKPNLKQAKALKALEGLKLQGARLSMARCDDAELKRLMKTLTAQRLAVSRIKHGYGNLEEVFLHLTGRQLRD